MTKVEQAIKESGYLKGWIAKQVGIAPGTLSLIIKGESKPSLVVAIKIARILNKSVEELWGYLVD